MSANIAYQPKPFVEHLYDAAWDQYEMASARAAKLVGAQTDLFDTAQEEAKSWRGIVDSLGAELRHG